MNETPLKIISPQEGKRFNGGSCADGFIIGVLGQGQGKNRRVLEVHKINIKTGEKEVIFKKK